MASLASGARFVLAVDVGGTFTDVIRHDATTGAVEVAKTASTPPDFIDGMLAGIDAVGARPAEIGLIKIGTTIATNTVIMRTGARTALVTTAGFTDVLHAARAARPTLYDSDWDPAPALVERRDTMTVAQRTTYEGEELEPLDEAGLRRVAARLRARGIEAVAVSFLHSYINDAHERRAQAILSHEMPGAYVCRSSDILPEIREFERTSTTVANAYLGPALERYLAALLARLGGIGYDGPVLITHSGGGVMSIEAARRIPARICQSGPAAGVMAGAAIGRRAERSDVIVLDVGGTSADVSLSRRGRPLIRPEWNIEFNIVISFPSVDVTSIGAGGGSIARIDDGGVLKVGPESAGARPGPACYGLSGTRPTATDANLVLGRLGARRAPCGGPARFRAVDLRDQRALRPGRDQRCLRRAGGACARPAPPGRGGTRGCGAPPRDRCALLWPSLGRAHAPGQGRYARRRRYPKPLPLVPRAPHRRLWLYPAGGPCRARDCQRARRRGGARRGRCRA